MQNFTVLSLILFFALLSHINGQQNRKVVFTGDLNANSKLDRIIEVKYKKPAKLLSYTSKGKYEIRNGHFIKYILYVDNLKRGKVIFDYLIGDDEAQYWQYRIDKTVDLNKDGLKDLIFYAGDDTTEEYVYLLQKSSHFKAVYSGALSLDFFYKLNKANYIVAATDEVNSRVAANWNPQREIFEGRLINWTTQNCKFYTKPNEKSKVLNTLSSKEVVVLSDKTNSKRKGWYQVKFMYEEGWINTNYLSKRSPFKNFPTK